MSKAILKLNKTAYPETIIRKSLYWLSKTCEWKLGDDSENWIIEFVNADIGKAQAEFSRLLNDQILREVIDRETKNIRKSIIKKVLIDIEKSL